MKFSVLVVVGDGKGMVGYGSAKAKEVSDAAKKAAEKAKKNMIWISLKEWRTIRYDVEGQAGAGNVILKSAKKGRGVIAGGAMRAVFDALGVSDIVGKSIGSGNYHTTVMATVKALKSLVTPKYVAAKLGKKLPEILARRRAFS
jgi:small subunit ribosomal protein S5